MKRHASRITAPLLICIAFAGVACQAPTAVTPSTRSPRVAHVLVCWLKQPGNTDDRRAVVEASYRFRSIPGVVDVYAGPALRSDRPIVDSTYDVGVVMTFADEAALRNYVAHPDHERAVKEVLGPRVARVQAYDFTVEP